MVSINYQNFLDEVRDDLKQMIIDNYPTRKALEEADRDTIYDEAFIDDSVTGNGSGSYYFNTWKSRENVMNNEEVVEEMIDEFGGRYEGTLERLGISGCVLSLLLAGTGGHRRSYPRDKGRKRMG